MMTCSDFASSATVAAISMRRRCRGVTPFLVGHSFLSLSWSLPLLLWSGSLSLSFSARTVLALNQTILPVRKFQMDAINTVFDIAEIQFPGRGVVVLSDVNFTLLPPSNATTNSSNDKLSISIVLVSMDKRCYKNRKESLCDWTDLGVGYNVAGEEYFCCTQGAVDQELCSNGNDNENGKREDSSSSSLLLNKDLFHGQTRTISVPVQDWLILQQQDQDVMDEETLSLHLKEPESFDIDIPGTYALLLANCNLKYEPSILVEGSTGWVTFEDELEAYIRESMPFYIVMTLLYGALWAWYAYHMKQNQASRINLEEWIRVVIILGFVNSLFSILEFRTLKDQDYGSRATIVAGFGSALTGIRHGLSRSLLLLLSDGLGVAYPTLHPLKMIVIVTLGLGYCVLEAVEDFLIAVGEKADSNFFLNGCILASLFIDIVFVIWIPVALCSTMHYLKTSNQMRKLDRYRKLLWILALAVLLTILLFTLIMWDAIENASKDITIYNLLQANDFNFFVIMVCVAWLYKPNPMAREFAYAMELSQQDYSGDDDVLGMAGDLELTENDSSSHNDGNNVNHQKDEVGTFTNGAGTREIS